MSQIEKLPNSVESEHIILGAILLDNTLMSEIHGKVLPLHFYNKTYRYIFQGMYNIVNDPEYQDGDIHPVAILEYLKQKNLEHILSNGILSISNLTQGIPRFSSLEKYAQLIFEKHQLRTLVNTCYKIISEAVSEGDAEETITKAEQAVIKIASKVEVRQTLSDLQTIVRENAERINSQKAGEGIYGETTGFNSIDKVTGGYTPQFYILCARPSMGKTSFLLRSMFLRQRKHNSKPCVFFSLEMDKNVVVDRMIAQEAGVHYRRYAQNRLIQDEWARINGVWEQFDTHKDFERDLKIIIDDRAGINVGYIRSTLRRVQQQYKSEIGFIGIDYAGLMSSNDPRIFEERQVLNAVCKEVAPLKKEFNCPTMLLHQINREGDERPSLKNLHGSGKFEMDADVVIAIHNEDKKKSKSEIALAKKNEVVREFNRREPFQVRQLLFLKNRNDAQHTINLRWFPESMKFDDMLIT